MTTSERHRWLTDGRFKSAGTRFANLNGRALRITVHGFDFKVVKELPDSAAVKEQRVKDAEAKAGQRDRAALQAKLKRTSRRGPRTAKDAPFRRTSSKA